MLTANQLGVQISGRTLFRDLKFSVGARDRIALVGPNGAGKSTLMKILVGINLPDDGTLTKPKDFAIGYLPQEGIHIAGTSLFNEAEKAFGDALSIQQQLDELSTALETHPSQSETYGDLLDRMGALQLRLEHHDVLKMKPRIETVLRGLGFHAGDFNRDCGEFSGGWQMRIALAKLLLQEPDVLLLDEPTNHLDLDSQCWLESYLQQFAGAIIVISHDQAFLDALISRVLSFESGRIIEYTGNYTQFTRERLALREQRVRAAKNQEREIAKQEKLIDRFRAKASKASMVQSRIKALEKIERLEVESEAPTVSFRFPPTTPSGQVVVSLDKVSHSYGNLHVFDNLDYTIERGDRIAVVGVNGAGKSTFARIVSGVEKPRSGERRLGHRVTQATFSQDHADALDGRKTVLQTVEEVATSALKSQARTVLGCFLFTGDDVYKLVSVLSGGERSRLALARMLVQPSNFLILDEPTNHLDMQSQEVLQRALLDFEGTVMIISHNRSFLDPIATSVLEFVPGKPPQRYWGNISDYLAKREADGRLISPAPSTASAPAPKVSRKEQRRREALARDARREKLRPLQKALSELEAAIAKNEEEKENLVKQMQDPKAFQDKEWVRETTVRLHSLDTELESGYSEWNRLTEEIEKFETSTLNPES